MSPGRLDREKSSKMRVRAFVAIPVPTHVVDCLGNIQAELTASGIHLRWVKPENSHLTLKFLGDIEPSIVPSIVDQMDRIAGSISSFAIHPKGLGVFPNFRRVRVVWTGLNGDVATLQKLQRAVDKAMAFLGFDADKKEFRPHLTLGRSKAGFDGRALERFIDAAKNHPCEAFMVEQLCLFQSDLSPDGATYTLLHKSQLGLCPSA
jgi:2'-5' RNA ligase